MAGAVGGSGPGGRTVIEVEGRRVQIALCMRGVCVRVCVIREVSDSCCAFACVCFSCGIHHFRGFSTAIPLVI